jgi:ribose transport system substrate-binding protein
MSKYFKSGLSVLTAAVLCFSVAACGDDEGGSPSSNAGTSAKEPEKKESPKVGLVLHFTAIDYFKRFIVGAEDGARDAGGEITVTGTPQPDPPAGVRMFRDLATKIDDGIAVVASPPDFWIRPLQEVADKGIPLLATVEPPAPGSETLKTFIGDNGQQTGATLAREIVDQIEDPDRSGVIVIGTGDPAIQTFIDRIAGMREVLEAELPNAEIVVQTVGFEPTKNLATWQSLFRKYRDEAIAFLADGEHSGANLAKAAGELPGDYKVGLVDMDIPTAEGIRDGKIHAAIGGVPYLRGYLTGRIITQAAADGVAMPEGWVDVCCEVATKDNIDGILERLNDVDAMRAYYKPIMDEEFTDLASITTRPMTEVAEALGPQTESNDWVTPPGS